jgi:chromosomal replication initiator protein
MIGEYFFVTAAHSSPWDLVKATLQKKVSAETYENWISRTQYAGIDGSTLVVTVPDSTTQSVLKDDYSVRIQDAARACGLPSTAIRFSVRPDDGAIPGRPDQVSELESPLALNPKFTFESFVVGASNQFAHAAAQSVATQPARRYNPLYLYGGVGMGKTHLMHAIGRALVATGSMRIIYTTCERFTNEVVSGIKHGRMPQLRERYRSADVLLIDDIQSLGSKDRTQEEFFHTFNELHDAQKQIVISGDCQPKEIPGLVDRLRSRFEWGLMADIEPPDLETRMAILEKKADIEGVFVPPAVRLLIAEKTKSSVRELEGALIKLIAYSSLTNTPISVPMARQALKNILDTPERRITIDAVQKAVAERYAIKPSALREKSNRKEIVVPRQVAMYLVKELTPASLPEIGRAFGGKHHTTVIHSIDKIKACLLDNPELNKIIHSVKDSLQ